MGVAIVCSLISCAGLPAYAENESENSDDSANNSVTIYGANISISPISKIMQLSPSSVYEDTFTVTNDDNIDIKFEVYAAPYSYTYSEESDLYTLGFSRENSYTQITRWVKFLDNKGNYVKNPTYTIGSGETMEISYKISTPDNIPAGGQYAVIFVHTLADEIEVPEGGIRTEASPGIIIYGRAAGETTLSAEISDLSIEQSITKQTTSESTGALENVTYGHINSRAKVKNTGNIDFNITAILKVEGIFGGAYYETPENKARTSIIPESELVITDEWENTPLFGLYKITWTVTAAGETQTIEKVIFINPMPFIIVSIILLTIIIVWIIIMVRKRKERRSRLSV